METKTTAKSSIRLLFENASEVCLSDAIDAFIRIELMRRMPQTRRYYKYVLGLLAKALGAERRLADIMEVDLIEWQVGILERELSTYTQVSYIQACKRLFKWFYKRGILPVDLGCNLESPGLPDTGRRGISPANAEAILAAARTNPRDYAILQFLQSTGARRGGVSTLMLGNLNLESNDERVRRRVIVYEKGGKERPVIMTIEALDALQAWLKVRPQAANDYVFLGRGGDPLQPESIRAMILRYKERLGLKGKVSPHSWRHRFSRDCIKKKMPMKPLSELLGHSNSKVTDKFYGDLDLDELQDLYDEMQKRKEGKDGERRN